MLNTDALTKPINHVLHFARRLWAQLDTSARTALGMPGGLPDHEHVYTPDELILLLWDTIPAGERLQVLSTWFEELARTDYPAFDRVDALFRHVTYYESDPADWDHFMLGGPLQYRNFDNSRSVRSAAENLAQLHRQGCHGLYARTLPRLRRGFQQVGRVGEFDGVLSDLLRSEEAAA